MIIDGHAIRMEAIDAVTAISWSVEDTHDQSGKIVRGSFQVFVRGTRLTISRGKVIPGKSNAAIEAGKKPLLAELIGIRNPIEVAMGK
jgi:hypothetical protein